MEAIILCGGYGTRMGELTKNTPKPLLEVNCKPILEHTLDHLITLGFKKAVINIAYLKEQFYVRYPITTTLRRQYKTIEIDFIEEDKPVGTAQTVNNIIKKGLIESQNFLVIYGDVISKHNHFDTYKYHQQTGAWITILYHARQISSMIVTDDNDFVTMFAERPLAKTNSGIYWLNKLPFKSMPASVVDLAKDFFTTFSGSECFRAIPHEGYRCAIDTKERLEQAREDLKCNTK